MSKARWRARRSVCAWCETSGAPNRIMAMYSSGAESVIVRTKERNAGYGILSAVEGTYWHRDEQTTSRAPRSCAGFAAFFF